MTTPEVLARLDLGLVVLTGMAILGVTFESLRRRTRRESEQEELRVNRLIARRYRDLP